MNVSILCHKEEYSILLTRLETKVATLKNTFSDLKIVLKRKEILNQQKFHENYLDEKDKESFSYNCICIDSKKQDASINKGV